VEWPRWWRWELELTPHVEKRMEQRRFSEVDLREMLHAATGWHVDRVEGRFIIEVRHRRDPWHVIVEPDEEAETLVVVTAYRVEKY
jgi:hypothetical protein